ncbi:hypothetical protein MJ579_23155 [Klebsiella pneumoniae]|nr:hypothetical protein MJ579_23155 [Klebsiella pneumoniae]
MILLRDLDGRQHAKNPVDMLNFVDHRYGCCSRLLDQHAVIILPALPVI